MTGKARRGASQVIVGLLVDRGGFPLQVGCFRGQPGRDLHDHPRGGRLPGRWRHRRARPWSPGAGMLSAINLAALDETKPRFIARGPAGKRPLLARGRPRRRSADRHHHLRKRLEERAGRT